MNHSAHDVALREISQQVTGHPTTFIANTSVLCGQHLKCLKYSVTSIQWHLRVGIKQVLKIFVKDQKEGTQNLLINENNIWRHNNKANIY